MPAFDFKLPQQAASPRLPSKSCYCSSVNLVYLRPAWMANMSSTAGVLALLLGILYTAFEV